MIPSLKALLRLGIVAGVLGGGAWGYHALCLQVENKLAVSARPPAILMKNRPIWMNDELADQIVRSIAPTKPRSATDHELLHEIADRLTLNPWIKKVRQVRRSFTDSVGDTVEITCEYRTPAALVCVGKASDPKEFILVDGDGVRLPIRFPASRGPDGKVVLPQVLFADGHTNLRIIDGVGAAAPKDGQLWQGEDLQAGLDLAKLLYGKPYTEDIYRIDVSNYHRRWPEKGSAEITLVTKYGTEIRWGEPVRMTFHAEVLPERKLERLAEILQRYSRIDANHSWIDIRLDQVTYPVDDKLVAGE